jgi:hypothetical protein
VCKRVGPHVRGRLRNAAAASGSIFVCPRGSLSLFFGLAGGLREGGWAGGRGGGCGGLPLLRFKMYAKDPSAPRILTRYTPPRKQWRAFIRAHAPAASLPTLPVTLKQSAPSVPSLLGLRYCRLLPRVLVLSRKELLISRASSSLCFRRLPSTDNPRARRKDTFLILLRALPHLLPAPPYDSREGLLLSSTRIVICHDLRYLRFRCPRQLLCSAL